MQKILLMAFYIAKHIVFEYAVLIFFIEVYIQITMKLLSFLPL